MKPFPALFWFLMFLALLSNAQVHLSGTIGMGQYAMQSLRDNNESNRNLVISELQVNPNQLVDFPPFPNFGLEIFRQDSNGMRYGLTIHYFFTGSRLYYHDYSGKLIFDAVVQALAIGFKASNRLVKKPLEMGFYAQPLILFNQSEFRSSLELYPAYSEKDYTKANSVNVGACLGLFARKRFQKVEVGIEAGFQMDVIKGLLKVGQNGKRYPLQNPETFKPLTTDWTGLRTAIAVSYYL